MSGTKYFLDTNAIISLLDGNSAIENMLSSATWIATSVICIIEFHSYTNLSSNDKILLYQLVQRISIIQIENKASELQQIADLRAQTRLKIPDAVIAANAMANNATLISNHSHFRNISNLSVAKF